VGGKKLNFDVRINVLGPLEIHVAGEPVELPASRKTLALLAILALEVRPIQKDRLCDMLWDVPDDPRGALRWSLSKIRTLLADQRDLLKTTRDTAALDPADFNLDWSKIASAVQRLSAIPTEELLQLNQCFRGEFLQGLNLSRCAQFDAWLMSREEQARRWHCDVLLALCGRANLDGLKALELARQLTQLAPENEQFHLILLQRLVVLGRAREALRQFEISSDQLCSFVDDHPLDLLKHWRREQRNLQIRAPQQETAVHARPGLQSEPLSEEPSIAIMPFTEQGDASEAGYLAQGMTEDLTTLLSQTGGLTVISSHSTYTYLSQRPDVRTVGAELGVRYVVEGTTRRFGENLRVSVCLIEAATRKNLWAEKMDRPLADIFAIQDELIIGIVGSLGNEVVRAELGRARQASPEMLGAWGKVARAMSHYYSGFSRQPVEQAIVLCREAIEMEPEYAPAHSLLAFNLGMSVANNYGLDLKLLAGEAIAASRRALELDPQNPLVVCHWGAVNGYLGKLATAEAVLERALELNPNSTLALAQMGRVLIGLGRAEQAVDYFSRAEKLSPRDINAFARELYRARAQLQLENYIAALAAAESSLASNNSWNLAWVVHGIALSALNRLDQAKESMATARQLDPKVEAVRYRDAISYIAGGKRHRLDELTRFFEAAW
jgi:TolB-like protein/Tfp pilus assembly protein PilF